MDSVAERKRLRGRMEKHQLSQAAVAQKAGFSESSLWHRMNDRALSDADVGRLDTAIDDLITATIDRMQT